MSSLQPNTTSNNTGSEQPTRTLLKQGTLALPVLNIPSTGKQLQFRIESPRTQLACHELGIELSNFTMKDIKEFGYGNCSQEIRQLRYDHYVSGIEKDMKNVLSRRRQNIKLSRQKLQNIIPDALLMQEGGARRSILAVSTSQPLIPDNLGRKSMVRLPQSLQQLNNSISDNRISSRQMKSVFNKTVGYLRQSHDQPDVCPGDEVILLEENEGSQIEQQFITEINKYNRLKMQKQKEAKILFDEDLERIKNLERMREKEMRLIEQTLKLEKEKQQKKEIMKKLAEEKSEKVKQTEQKYEKMKKEERDKIKKKLELIKARQEKENEERNRLKEEQKLRVQEKRERVKQNLIRKEQELESEHELKRELITAQLENASEIQKFILSNKVMRLKDKLDQETYKIEQLKEIRLHNEKEDLSCLVENLVKREEHFNEKLLENIIAENERKIYLKNKEEQTLAAKQKVRSQQSSKMSDFKQKLQIVEQNIQRKKMEEEERLILKSELRKLMELDVKELNKRKGRSNDYRHTKHLEKGKLHSEKLKYIKEQQEFLKKAKQEVSQQTKQESERIFDSVKKISNTLFPNSAPSHTLSLHSIPPENKEKGFSMIKSIFRSEIIDLSVFNPPPKEDPTQKKP